MGRIGSLWVLLGLALITVSIYDFRVSADVIPSENECRPYIEKAIHELKNVEVAPNDEQESTEATLGENESIESDAVPETGAEEDATSSTEEHSEKSIEDEKHGDDQNDSAQSQENQTEENASVEEPATVEENSQQQDDDSKQDNAESAEADNKSSETEGETQEADDGDSKEEPQAGDGESQENPEGESNEQAEASESEAAAAETESQENDSKAQDEDSKEAEADSKEADADSKETDAAQDANEGDSAEPADEAESEQANEASNEESQEKQDEEASVEETDSKEEEATSAEANEDSKEGETAENESQEENKGTEEESVEETVRAKRSIPDEAENAQSTEDDSVQNESQETANESAETESQENVADNQEEGAESQENEEGSQEEEKSEEVEEKELPEEDLTMEFEIPKNLRPRGHVNDLLGLDAESSIKENALKRTGDVILKELKRVFDNAIHPLETMYKYRDLSNRHFGDPEIFSKPLILFMGPWSGGKSTILNYLTDNEYTPNSIRSGAEPSPAYFNILMHGDEPEVLDGTQLAADWTFSGLQKFGQGLMDRLRGQKLPSKLLERVNIVEIPGILEVRKQVSRYFPFNDACQWFIDRADIIFLVYDPSKLDVGPETEAILDQLKGREYQTRILLNKADQVKPEELLRVQGALIWNISPLMSSAQPPVMYTVSLWSHPFENGAPIRLLQAQERAFLADLREAIDRRIENKIASARRFAVRIRNHAKMVDCYLTTYYNQKGLFSNKKQVSDKIIEHPQNYNIYEGLSTLTNISRYDLPDPEVYLDFFRLNPLYEFKKLSETCTYFKGCPINKLDIAIAYDLPELVGKYKKILEQNLIELRKEYEENCNQTEPEPPVKIIKSR